MISARWHAIRPLLVVLVCCLPVLMSSAWAQTPLAGLRDGWRWRWYGAESGLPAAPIDRILETPSGEMWVVTRAGLAWYNGNFWQSPPSSPQLPLFSGVGAIADSAGVILCSGGSLYRVDHAGYHAIPLPLDVQHITVRKVAPLKGRGLILQSDSLLYLLSHGILVRFPSPFDEPGTRRVPETTFGIYDSEDDMPVLNTASGLYRWHGDRWSVLLPLKGEYLTMISFCDDAEGRGSVCCRIGKDLCMVEWGAEGMVTRTTIMPSQAILTTDFGLNGDLLALDQSGEVLARNGTDWIALTPTPAELTGVTTIRFDRTGALWVGKSNGVQVCDLPSKIWNRLIAPLPGAMNSANALLFTADSLLWVGTSDGVLVYRDTALVRVIRSIGSRTLGVVTALAQDPAGGVWVGSGSAFGGAYRWDGNAWKYFGAREGLTDNGVHRIIRDREGRLWFLTISFYSPGLFPELEDGAFVYERGTFERMDRRNGLPDGRAYGIAEDDHGTRWFATGKGLGRFRDDRWTYWTTDQGLRTNKVFCLTLDRQGRLWFGHQTQGLGYIDTNDVPVYMTPEKGFTNTGVWDLAVDSLGRVWAATRQGVAVYDDGIWSVIDQRDGLPNPNVWPLLLRDSLLYIGMSNAGVAVLNLSRLDVEAPAVLFGKPVDRGDVVTVTWQAFAPRGIPFGREIPTRYRLDGGEWSRWEIPRPLDLRNLPFGEHTVTVQSRGPLAQVDPRGATLRITIPPPFYLRPAFLVPVGFLTGLLLVLGVMMVRRRSQHSRELHERDARLRAVLDQQTEVIVRVLPDGTLSFVNGAVCRALRSAPERLIGQPFHMTFPHPDAPAVAPALWSMGTAGMAMERDVPYHAPEGGERWIHWVSRGIADGKGTVHEYQMIGRDITETKVAQHDLAKGEERYRITAEATGQLVYDLDLPTGRISWQGAILAVTGYAPEEFATCDRKRLSEMIHPEDRERVRMAMDEGREGLAPVQIEFRLRKKDGTYIDIYDNGVFLASSGGDPERKLGTMTDVSARKQVEAQIAASLKEKEVLLKEIHHRVKNNLQVISSLLSLQSGTTNDTYAQEQLRESQNRIRTMALIHERLYQSENLAEINFGVYVQSLGAFLSRSYNVPGVHILYAVDPCHLPVNMAIPCGLVINELVSNALKYAFRGRTQGEIEITFTLLRGNRAVLTVRDDGVGFPSELDFRSTKSLGLQLVNTLASQLSGTIGLIRDRGTTFTITMPLEDVHATA